MWRVTENWWTLSNGQLYRPQCFLSDFLQVLCLKFVPIKCFWTFAVILNHSQAQWHVHYKRCFVGTPDQQVLALGPADEWWPDCQSVACHSRNVLPVLGPQAPPWLLDHHCVEGLAKQGEAKCIPFCWDLCWMCKPFTWTAQRRLSCHNALSRSGLRLLLDAVTSIREGGLVWIATQCSSWVVLCRHQSQRCEANGFLGCQRPFVVLGNNLMMISCILFWVAHLVGLHVVLEQPSSSVMPLCRPMRTVLEVTCSRRFNTYMGSFNGPSVKPLQLWSPWSKVALLEREKPVGMVAEPLVQHHGDHQFTGFKDKLAESQQYTCEFGQAVMEICRTEWSD